MSNWRRVLERHQKEREEIRRKRTQEDRDVDEEEEQMLAAAVCMMDQSRQHRRRRATNMDRRRESRGKNLLEDYFIPKLCLYDLLKINNWKCKKKKRLCKKI